MGILNASNLQDRVCIIYMRQMYKIIIWDKQIPVERRSNHSSLTNQSTLKAEECNAVSVSPSWGFIAELNLITEHHYHKVNGN
jgi:hypothetical protein